MSRVYEVLLMIQCGNYTSCHTDGKGFSAKKDDPRPHIHIFKDTQVSKKYEQCECILKIYQLGTFLRTQALIYSSHQKNAHNSQPAQQFLSFGVKPTPVQ